MIRAKIRILLKYKTFGNILDIGCGTGEFLNEIEKSNFSATGIEPNTLARNFAISKYNLNVLDENEIDHLAGSNYNIITLWHVLEHVYDINFRIIQIRKLLAEEGILVIAVPNFDSWDAQHYQKYWAAYDLPRHLYHFNQQSINRLFQKHGFSLMKIRPMIFDSFYISIVSEKYKNSKSSFFKGILIGLFSNIWAFMNQKNYSSLIYIFKLNKT
jgi:predicted TPR repeat methyltransferase